MTESAGAWQRFKEELRAYAAVSLYLWVCFTILLLYKNSLLQQQHGQLLPLSVALVKALVLGKFILIGKAAGVGTRRAPRVLLYRILWKSLASLVMLIVFVMLEELVAGLVHGHAAAQVLGEFWARPAIEKLAPSLVMLLVLIPMIAFQEIDSSLGSGGLRRLLLDPGEQPDGD